MTPAAILRSPLSRFASRPAGAAALFLVSAASAAVFGLTGCDQDTYSSTDQRDTHMGDIHAAAPPPPPASASAAAPAAAAMPPAASASH
jgi:hypothetical protein